MYNFLVVVVVIVVVVVVVVVVVAFSCNFEIKKVRRFFSFFL